MFLVLNDFIKTLIYFPVFNNTCLNVVLCSFNKQTANNHGRSFHCSYVRSSTYCSKMLMLILSSVWLYFDDIGYTLCSNMKCIISMMRNWRQDCSNGCNPLELRPDCCFDYNNENWSNVHLQSLVHVYSAPGEIRQEQFHVTFDLKIHNRYSSKVNRHHRFEYNFDQLTHQSQIKALASISTSNGFRDMTQQVTMDSLKSSSASSIFQPPCNHR